MIEIGSPIYLQIYEDIKKSIETDEYQIGDRIPSEKELAEKWSVSSITPRRALEMLRSEGYIVRQAGRGTFVKEKVFKSETSVSRIPLIGVIFTDFDESFGIGLLNGIEHSAEGRLNFLFRRSFGDLNKEEKIIEEFRDLKVDGFIILPSHATHFNSAILELVVDDIPLVLIDRYLRGLGTTAVSTNNVKAAEIGTDYLFDLGHKHITVLSPPTSYAVVVEDRVEGILKAAGKTGKVANENISIIDNIISTLPGSFKELNISKDIEQIEKHLQENPQKTAIFAIEHNIALLAKQAISNLGLNCPNDIAIICFDSPAFKPGAFTFTHLIQDQEKIGSTAIEKMLSILSSGNKKQVTLIDAKLVKGDSTEKIKAH